MAGLVMDDSSTVIGLEMDETCHHVTSHHHRGSYRLFRLRLALVGQTNLHRPTSPSRSDTLYKRVSYGIGSFLCSYQYVLDSIGFHEYLTCLLSP